MSTRSVIARETANGIEAIYCHRDGCPEHHLPILTGHYATDEAVAALMELGDLSVLGPELGRRHKFDKHGMTSETWNWCLAYGRDRAEDDTDKVVYDTEEQLMKGSWGLAADYVYLFRAGRWQYRNAPKGAGWVKA